MVPLDNTDTASTAEDTSLPTPTGTTPVFELEISVAVEGDGIAFRSNLPARVEDCLELPFAAVPCDDLDADGLVDRWEDSLLERTRPAIRFDESEQLVNDADAVTAMVARVYTPSPARIHAYIMLGYHYDYGRCGLSFHNGDSERVAMSWIPLDGGGPGDVVLDAAYTAAHEGTITDHGRVFSGAELNQLVFPVDPGTGEPRWMVFSSDGKHATYGNAQLCEDAEWAPCLEEDCEADGVDALAYTLLMDGYNAGEPGVPLLTDLSGMGFPGEQAWVDQDFCGGLARGAGCASPVLEKLTTDPF